MSHKTTSKKSGEIRYATRHFTVERGRRHQQSKEMAPLKACRNLLKSDDWENSKFSLTPKNSKKSIDRKNNVIKEIKTNKHSKNREKVVIVSKKSSSVRVVKSGSQRCLKGIQRSVSVKKVSYSTSVILSSDEEEDGDEEGEDESDTDDEDDDYDEKTTRRGTIIKHTMSKIKTDYCKSKKSDNKSTKKTLKMLREKHCGKKKGHAPSRELRPRFPYSPTQEWPTARAHRMASLNALAKVHVLYENEGRPHGEPEENSLSDSMNEDNSSCDTKLTNAFKEKDKNSKNETNERQKKNIETKPKIVKRKRKRKHPCDVELIDTRICKRMASLNAQAILAASYLQEKPKRKEKMKSSREKSPSNGDSDDVDIKEIFVESSCNLQIVDSMKDNSPLESELASPQEMVNHSEATETVCSLGDSKEFDSLSPKNNPFDDKDKAANVPGLGSELHISTDPECTSTLASTSVSEVGVTKYTKVTKVQINTTKEMGVKDESKAERKIERIFEKDDVAITRMYHYQSNTASQSYCVRMETTFKPGSRNFPPIVDHQRSPIPPPHVMGAVMPTRQSYYNYQNRPGILPSQTYPISRSMQPVMGINPNVARQYGSSAFTVPHYGHPQPLTYPHNEYGYYQPAGPMIQPINDQYMIHKPVPCHPQPHQQIPHTQPLTCTSTASSSNRECHTISGSTCFPSKSEPPPIKFKHNDLKPNDTSRHRPPNAHSNQFLNRTINEHQRPGNTNQAHVHASDLQRQEMIQKHFRGYDSNRNNYKCQIANTYTSAHDHHYPIVNQQNCPPVNRQQQEVISQHSKMYPNMMRHDGNATNQYLPSHPSLSSSINIIPKSESSSSSSSSSTAATTSRSSLQQSQKFNLAKYQNSQFKEVVSAPQNSEIQCDNKSQCVWRPPLVVDLESDSEPKNTKTYIELDVPKACPREKIVVVDVDKEESLRKQAAVKKFKQPSFSHVASKPDIIELPTPKQMNRTTSIVKSHKKFIEEQKEEAPEIVLIEMKKKEPSSSIIKRAKTQGKQRIYHDSENRPLTFTNPKRDYTPDPPAHYQKPAFQPQVSLPLLTLPRNIDMKRHGWTWEGKPAEQLVFVTNDDPPFLRLCYPAMRHQEGDVIKVRDCVLLKSGPRKTDLPFIAKIAALWENPNDGEMTMSLLWYYRPEHTELGRKPYHTSGEIFASKHCDTNSVACIEDKCYVLTFGEYCRYKRHCKMLESTCESPVSVVPPMDEYSRKERLPPSCISPDMVFYCRKVYDFRQKRILKNPI